MQDSALLRVEDLQVHFPLKQSLGDVIARKAPRYVRAVNGVSFELQAG